MSSENRFYDEIKGRLEGYTPEAPVEIFGMARSQFVSRRFFRFQVQHFNIWYLALVLAGASAAVIMARPKNDSAVIVPSQPEIQPSQPIQSTPANEVAVQETDVQKPVQSVKKSFPSAENNGTEVVSEASTVTGEKPALDPLPQAPAVEETKSKSLNVKVLKERR